MVVCSAVAVKNIRGTRESRSARIKSWLENDWCDGLEAGRAYHPDKRESVCELVRSSAKRHFGSAAFALA